MVMKDFNRAFDKVAPVLATIRFADLDPNIDVKSKQGCDLQLISKTAEEVFILLSKLKLNIGVYEQRYGPIETPANNPQQDQNLSQQASDQGFAPDSPNTGDQMWNWIWSNGANPQS